MVDDVLSKEVTDEVKLRLFRQLLHVTSKLAPILPAFERLSRRGRLGAADYVFYIENLLNAHDPELANLAESSFRKFTDRFSIHEIPFKLLFRIVVDFLE